MLEDIPRFKFMTMTDGSGLYYGCSIQSLHHLTGTEPVLNPYNRLPISPTTLHHINVIYKTPHILEFNCPAIEPVTTLSLVQTYNLRVVNVFQTINALGNLSDPTWFLDLSVYDTAMFIKHLRDIWRYRAAPSDVVRREICPSGDPFNVTAETPMDEELPVDVYLKTKVLQTVERLVQSGVNVGSRTLGSFYVLSALTLVSPRAAMALPWLYQAVQEDNML
jgi:hypothetical protein